MATIAALVLLTVFVLLRVETHGSAFDRHLSDGMSELAVASAGDAEAYDEAIDSFREASVLSFLDDYPVFLLSAATRMQSIAAGAEVEMPNKRYYQALANGHPQEACKMAAEFETDTAAEYALRLCRSLDGSVEEAVE